jgi:myo-inositol-1-phosphate synthase
MSKLGVVIVGVNGAVATTLIAGVELMKRGLAPKLGMVTERTDDRIAESLTALLEFARLEYLVFAGWDVRYASVYEGALQHKVLPRETLDGVKGALEAVKPWPAVFARAYAQNVVGDNTVRAATQREEIAAVVRDVTAFKRAHGLERVVMVNLASTEAFLESSAAHATLEAFEAALDASSPEITPAMRYFYAAAQLGVPYCNFAPSLTNVPALALLAARTGTPFAGMDGKTGQTLLKTALAAMLRVRRLKIEGWYSTNFLGNNDGLVLDAPGSNKTKVLSKSSVLDSIVGYHVENHQVHIHYYRPRGDNKEAWDNVDIVGFAGVPMQMKINFLCQDSALAAPLVVDLVRLLDVAKRVGESGIQRQLSLFFKSPYHAEGETPVHDLFKQEQLLLTWARDKSAKLRASNGHALAPSHGHVNGGNANGHAHVEAGE